MSVDIIQDMKKDFPSFIEIFYVKKEVKKVFRKLQDIVEQGIDWSNIYKQVMTITDAEGLPHFTAGIIWYLFAPKTHGSLVSKEKLFHHEQYLKELLEKYPLSKVRGALRPLYHGSDRFDMLAHEFFIYHFGSKLNCQFEKSFDSSKSFDIYVKELDLAIEVKAASNLNELRQNGTLLTDNTPSSSSPGIKKPEEILKESDPDDRYRITSFCGNCPNDMLHEAFLEAVDHTYEKQGEHTGKMLCAFSLPYECIHQLFDIMSKMNREGELDRSLYYLFHDPRGYLGSLFNADLGRQTFDSSTVYFVQFSENDDLLSEINCAFCDYEGKFEYVPAYYYKKEHLRSMLGS